MKTSPFNPLQNSVNSLHKPPSKSKIFLIRYSSSSSSSYYSSKANCNSIIVHHMAIKFIPSCRVRARDVPFGIVVQKIVQSSDLPKGYTNLVQEIGHIVTSAKWSACAKLKRACAKMARIFKKSNYNKKVNKQVMKQKFILNKKLKVM